MLFAHANDDAGHVVLLALSDTDFKQLKAKKFIDLDGLAVGLPGTRITVAFADASEQSAMNELLQWAQSQPPSQGPLPADGTK